MKKIILHIDMDYFFAQIEERENPQFRGKPIVVGADPKKGRGVVSTCNYLARKYGIHSGMPISKAWRLCPEAIFLPVNIEFYKKVSEKIMEIVKKYSPKCEIVSLDEAYLDLTEICGNEKKCYQKAENLAKKLKKEIFKKEGLTSTIGIGPNKLVAKIAAQIAKPNGLLIVKPNKVEKFLDPLDIEMIPGIGPKTAQKLREIGINKIGELKKLSKEKLKEMFGKVGEYFFEAARGIDKREVEPERERKSIGRQITFEKDTRDPEVIFNTFEEILKEISRKLAKEKFSFKTIVVLLRTSDFVTRQLSKRLKEASKDFSILKRELKKLLLKFLIKNKKPLRLIGVRLKI